MSIGSGCKNWEVAIWEVIRARVPREVWTGVNLLQNMAE